MIKKELLQITAPFLIQNNKKAPQNQYNLQFIYILIFCKYSENKKQIVIFFGIILMLFPYFA